jgi:hypothetical protein
MIIKECNPCPFCGCPEIDHKTMKYNGLTEWQILKCHGCGASKKGLKLNEVIKSWNIRAKDE